MKSVKPASQSGSTVKKKVKQHLQPINKVELMPAAVNSMALNEFLGVKYGKPKGTPFTAEQRFGIKTMYLPDRTVYVGRGNSNTLGLTVEDLDVVLPLSPLSNPETLKGLGFNYMMVTPERLATSDYVRRNGVVGLFSDSGGFQMSKGVVDFVEPDSVIDFYKRKIDFGIGLDVPLPRHLQSTDWFIRMARIQCANNKYIAKGLEGSKCELYDVSHGLTLENRKRYLEDVLEHKSAKYLAMGGIGQANYDTVIVSTVMAVVNLCYVVDRAKNEYERFHILGTTSSFFLSVYALLTEMGVAPFISCDSSTYAQSGLAFQTRGTMYKADMGFIPAFPIEHQPIGYGLPCSCPVCSLVGYQHVYRMSQPSNGIHTLIQIKKAKDITSDLAKLLLQGKPVMQHLLNTITSNRSLDPIYRALYRFIMDMDQGFDKAWANHRDTLKSSLRKEHGASGLFQKSAVIPKELKKAEECTTKAIMRYEAFHGLKPVKAKSKVKK